MIGRSWLFMWLFGLLAPRLVSAPLVRMTCQETPKNVTAPKQAIDEYFGSLRKR